MTDERVTAELADVTHVERKPWWRRLLEIGLSLGVIAVMFAFVLPRVTGSDYAEVWDRLRTLSGAQVAGLTLVWFVGLCFYANVLCSALPGLSSVQGLVVTSAGSAVSNTVPFGGALGVAATYAICASWGHPIAAITLAILVTGVWNVFTKLGLPMLALVFLVLAGEATGSLALAAVIGALVLGLAFTVLTSVLRSEPAASRIGTFADRVGARGAAVFRRPPPQWHDAVLEFRHRSIGLVRARWPHLTVFAALYYSSQFVLLLLCLRFLGSDVGWVGAFAAYTFGRLLSMIPITPAGLGFVEAGAASALVAFGADAATATAAILLFSSFVFLAEIPLGATGWLVWGTKRSWRRPIPPPTGA